MATGIVLQRGDIVPGILLRVPRHGIVIEYAYDLGHCFLQLMLRERLAALE